MRLFVTPSELAPELVRAFNETDCVAARTGAHTVEVLAPWLLDGDEPEHAATELTFFVRAWAAGRPGVRALLLDAS